MQITINYQKHFRQFSSFLILFLVSGTIQLTFGQPSPSPTPKPIDVARLHALADLSRIDLPAYAAQIPNDYFPVHLQSAFNFVRSAEYNSALQELDKTQQEMEKKKLFSRNNPDKFYLLKGLAELLSEQPQEAVRSFKLSLKLRGSNSDTLFLIGVGQIKLKDFQSARVSLQESIWFNRGKFTAKELSNYLSAQTILLAEKPNLDEIKNVLQQSIKANKAFTPARVQLALLSLESGEKGKAVGMLRDAVNAAPDDYFAKLSLGRALLVNSSRAVNKNDIDDALSLAKESLAVPNLSATDRESANILLLRAMIEEGQLPAAEDLLKNLLAENRNSAEYLKIKNQIEIEKQAAERAAELAAAAASASPSPSPERLS